MRSSYRLELTKHWLRRHEGLRLEPYLDSVGHITVGYGHNLDANPYTPEQLSILDQAGLTGGSIDVPFAELLLQKDLEGTVDDMYYVFGPAYDTYTDRRAALLTDMMFNLGYNRFSGFSRMIASVELGDWTRAAAEALDSKWATQVGQRSIDVAKALREG